MTTKSQTQSNRIWFIDFFRTIAVLGMIIYHLFFDLYYFGLANIDPFSVPLIILARIVAIIFLFLVGYSFMISQTKYQNITSLFTHTIKRALTLFLLASLISLVTFFINPSLTVRFGILNLISVSILLLVPISRLKVGYVLSILTILIVFSLFKTAVPPPSFDYFPLIPWFSIILIGYLTAKLLPPATHQKEKYFLCSPITWISKNSLLLYLIHQPIILLTLLLLKG